MHPNPAFRRASLEENIAFARQRSFGVLALNAAAGPLLSHIPFQLSEDGASLEAHIVRSNPIARLLERPIQGVVAVSGGDGYVSPDWYQIADQVPTWNYVGVHLRGAVRRLEEEALPGILQRLSANMEERLKPKPVWTIEKMDKQVYTRLLRQIIPIKMSVNDIQGTWKLSQNKPHEVRKRAAERLQKSSVGVQLHEIAALMQGYSR